MPLITELTRVKDGEQLMQVLNDENNLVPQLLFLDLNMPRRNGFECLEEIKKNKKLSALPVVIFSTSYEQEVVNELYKSGAQYFIRKPSEFSQYKKIIFHILTLTAQDIGNRGDEAGNKDTSMAQPSPASFVLTVENIATI